MTPKVGEVYPVDSGYEGKVRPVVVMSREDSEAPRARQVVMAALKGDQKPVTTESEEI